MSRYLIVVAGLALGTGLALYLSATEKELPSSGTEATSHSHAVREPLRRPHYIGEEKPSRPDPWNFSSGALRELLITHGFGAYETQIGGVVSSELRSFSLCSQEEKAGHQTTLKRIFDSLQKLEKHLNSAYVANADSFANIPTKRKQLYSAAGKVRYLLSEISGKF